MFEYNNKNIKDYIDNILIKIKEKYYKKDVIIPVGKYRGRIGNITYIGCDYSGICMMIQPYNKKTGQLMFDHRHARTYWSVENFDSLEIVNYE